MSAGVVVEIEPGAPPVSSSDPMLIATPKQMVATSGRMNCIVS